MRLAPQVCVTEFDAREIHSLTFAKSCGCGKALDLEDRVWQSIKEKIATEITEDARVPSPVARDARHPLPKGEGFKIWGGFIRRDCYRYCAGD